MRNELRYYEPHSFEKHSYFAGLRLVVNQFIVSVRKSYPFATLFTTLRPVLACCPDSEPGGRAFGV